MTYAEFKKLDDDAKAQISLQYAVPVATREVDGCKYILYQLFSFYIEGQFTLAFNAITEYRAFENMALIEPYLEEVNLEDLYFK